MTGKTQEGGKSANILQELQLPVLKNEQCIADYDAIGKKLSDKQFDDAVLCAGYREGWVHWICLSFETNLRQFYFQWKR